LKHTNGLNSGCSSVRYASRRINTDDDGDDDDVVVDDDDDDDDDDDKGVIEALFKII
jgi:hypothetical protein